MLNKIDMGDKRHVMYHEFIKDFSFIDEATKFLNENLFSVPKIKFKYSQYGKEAPKTDFKSDKDFEMLKKSYEMYYEKVKKARERIKNQITEIYNILESKGIIMNSYEITKEKFLNSTIWGDFTDEKSNKYFTKRLNKAINEFRKNKEANIKNFQGIVIDKHTRFVTNLKNTMHNNMQKFLNIEIKIKSLKSIVLEDLKKYRGKDLITVKALINSDLKSCTEAFKDIMEKFTVYIQ